MFELSLLIGAIAAATLAFIWLALTMRKVKLAVGAYNERSETVRQEIGRIFTDEFREELRNRGRLQFEKIIKENAMFLQQDLGLTASQINEYMSSSLKKVLKEEFDKYKTSISDAKESALSAITKTQAAMEEQRQALTEELKSQVAAEKQRLMAKFDAELSRVANRYILEALADEVDLSAQSDYIFSNLEAHKAEIVKDVTDAG